LLESPIPICNYSVSGVLETQNTIQLIDNGSVVENSWIFESQEHQQIKSKYGVNFFPGCCSIISKITDWNDGNTNNYTYLEIPEHQFLSPNNYNIILTINSSQKSNTQILPVKITWQTPIVDFSISNLNPYPEGETGYGENIILTNLTTDPDNREFLDSWYYDWYLYDSGTIITSDLILTHQQKSTSPNKKWQNPGIHQINLKLNYWDGFEWKILEKTKNINQHVWVVSNGLTWQTPVNKMVETQFSPLINGDTTYIYDVDYFVSDDTEYVGLNFDETFNHTFIDVGIYNILQTINYHNGFVLTIKQQTFQVRMSPIADFNIFDSECGKRYVSNSLPGTPPITNYSWSVIDEQSGDILATLSNASASTFFYSWAYTGDFKIQLSVTDSNNETALTEKTYNITDCPNKQPVTPIIQQNIGYGSGGPLAKVYYTEPETSQDYKSKKIKIVAEYLSESIIKTPPIYYKKQNKNKYVKVVGEVKNIREKM